MSLDTTKADDIALVIEEAIVAGELEPGTVLRQEQLSAQFNVSRTPIREALPRLAPLAQSARRSFSGPAVWAPGDHSIDGLYAKNAEQHRAIRQALAAGSPEGARALARDHVLSSFGLLEAILEQVGGTWPQPRRETAKVSS